MTCLQGFAVGCEGECEGRGASGEAEESFLGYVGLFVNFFWSAGLEKVCMVAA